MRDFEKDFDFDFEEGVKCRRTRDLRNGDDCHTLSGMQESRIAGVEQVFTPEREARIKAHCKRIQKELNNEAKTIY